MLPTLGKYHARGWQSLRSIFVNKCLYSDSEIQTSFQTFLCFLTKDINSRNNKKTISVLKSGRNLNNSIETPSILTNYQYEKNFSLEYQCTFTYFCWHWTHGVVFLFNIFLNILQVYTAVLHAIFQSFFNDFHTRIKIHVTVPQSTLSIFNAFIILHSRISNCLRLFLIPSVGVWSNISTLHEKHLLAKRKVILQKLMIQT